MKARLALFLIKLFALIPYWFLHWLGGGVGRLMWITNSRMAKVARKNVELCFPHLSAEEQLKMARTSIIETGRAILKTAKIWSWSPAKGESKIVDVQGLELIEKAKSKGQGTIWVTLHHGNWEMLVFFFSSINSKITCMFKPTNMEAFDQWMTESRERFGLTMVEANKRGVLALTHNIKANKDVLLLPDQEPSRKSGVFAPFFGVQALTGKLTTYLANANPDATLLYVYALPVKGGYSIRVIEGNPAVAQEDFEQSAAVLNQDLERCIQDHPEYFQWGYKRFKLRPEGEPKIYQGY